MKNRKENPKYRHTKTQNGKLYIAYFPSLKQKKITLVIHYRIQDERLKSYKAPTTLVRF